MKKKDLFTATIYAMHDFVKAMSLSDERRRQVFVVFSSGNSIIILTVIMQFLTLHAGLD